jgi:acetate kinase
VAAAKWLRESQAVESVAVGHRVVHGGPEYDRPVVVDPDVLARLERYSIACASPSAQQPSAYSVASDPSTGTGSGRLFRYGVPSDPQRTCRPLCHPRTFLSLNTLPAAPSIAKERVIVAHLGSGASMCALSGGSSVESTMGFTALDGLPMGTRPGQIDPGVLLYLITEKQMSAAAVENLLYRESGLKGLSGISNDMRELKASDAPGATLAIDYFVYRVGLNAGLLAAALGGLDAFVFTAGIGENSIKVRARIAEKLAWLGAIFDAAANEMGKTLISRPEGKVGLYVVPTDEELMIARHTFSLLRGELRG